MYLEKAKKKYKIYNWLFISIIIINFILFICAITPEFNMVVIFTVSLAISIIPFIIIKNKRKSYKKLIYDLSIQENAIKDTLDDKILK